MAGTRTSIRATGTTIVCMVVRRRQPSLLAASGRSFLLACLLLLLAASTAGAHPLGNFSVNHQTRVEISRDRVDLLYILDQAEIPTSQERNLSRNEILSRKIGEVRDNLWLIVNGQRKTLRTGPGVKLTFPEGAGDLPITRVELPLYAGVERPRLVEVRDFTFEGRIGWTDLVAVPGKGTAVRTPVSRSDPTDGLRDYSGVSLSGVPDQPVGRFLVRRGAGTLDAPSAPPAGGGGGSPARGASDDSSGDGFTNVFEDAASGEGVFLVLLLAAFAWGALHALSPGHGKAMVAAYLVGTRGTAKHAVALGGIVTVTHTIGVFALGLVTLFLSQYILPEDLYPWLNLAAGLLIVAVGLGVLRARVRWGRAQRSSAHTHDHGNSEEHGHDHDHDHVPDTTWKGLAGMGISAGLIPCPTALVVLLAAISQHEVALGLLLIVVFSVGLASTLTGLGLGVVYAKRLASRFSRPRPDSPAG